MQHWIIFILVAMANLTAVKKKPFGFRAPAHKWAEFHCHVAGIEITFF
jgi:hypothetical protein